jgi:tetratricopeptide (TPR) repeat protein
LAKYPNDPRTLFYLANSWRDAGNKEKALKYYHKRAVVKGGWDQERYVSLYNILQLESNFETKLETAWKAYELDPRRLEVQLLMMREGLRYRKKLHQIYAMAVATTNREALNDFLFTDPDIYNWRYDDILTIMAFTCMHYKEAVVFGERALAKAPESEKPRIEATLKSVKAQISAADAALNNAEQPH